MSLFQSTRNMLLVVVLVIVFITLGVGIFVYTSLFSAPQHNTEVERFIVSRNFDNASLSEDLIAGGFIKSERGLRFVLQFKGMSADKVQPGGYQLSQSMNAFEIANVLSHDPYMKWVVIPEGWRREQIADLLGNTLGWTDEEIRLWVTSYTAVNTDKSEGVYFPDTYLISVDEDPQDVAERLRTRFNEVFAPYLEEANRQNIKWTTLLKIASLIQREAAGKNDMSLIAGILWNRLLNEQKLDIDATVQYERDTRLAYVDNEYQGIDNWWAPITGNDTRNIDSPYNTYLHKGLPPHPIANPGSAAIEAVLFPEVTDCFYYLHDNDGNIHCSVDYAGHQTNINQYLR